MNAAVPVKWRHHDFANVLATRTLLADTFIGFRIGGILIAHGTLEGHYIGVQWLGKSSSG
jgi:hypothetical protein